MEQETEREARKKKLKKTAEQLLQAAKEEIANIPISGIRECIRIDGKEHKMLHYPSGQNKVPVYFDIHGGGFAWGLIEDGDPICQKVRDELGYEAYSLDYPLTPEVEYPTALEWLYETIRYMVNHAEEYHLDTNRMVIGGRSAGANLAVALCLLAKERNEFQFCCQIIDHPKLDLCGCMEKEEEEVLELILCYATEEQRKEITCSPLAAKREELEGLPMAIVQTAGLDSLKDEGEAYAKKLEEAGVAVTYRCCPGVIHGFSQARTPEGEEGREWLVKVLKERMSKN